MRRAPLSHVVTLQCSVYYLSVKAAQILVKLIHQYLINISDLNVYLSCLPAIFPVVPKILLSSILNLTCCNASRQFAIKIISQVISINNCILIFTILTGHIPCMFYICMWAYWPNWWLNVEWAKVCLEMEQYLCILLFLIKRNIHRKLSVSYSVNAEIS